MFFAPKDNTNLEPLTPCFDLPGEFVAYPKQCNPAWASYCMSPAALFTPQAFSDNGDGEFWQAP